MTKPMPISLAEVLKFAQIKRATVIDDVFDPPGEHEIKNEDLQAFAQTADAADDTRAAAQALGMDVTGGPDQGADIRRQLWTTCTARKQTPLGVLASAHLFSDRLNRKKDLDRLCASLQQVALSVKVFGADDDKLAGRRAQLIFLDYHLDPSVSVAADMGKRAVQKIEEIKFSKKGVPYIILISDQNVSEKARADICRAVNRKGAFFGFIHKRDLQNGNVLCLKLAELGVGVDAAARTAIRRFTTEAAEAIGDAAASLKDLLASLELQDYVHLQNRKLEGDGEALGEYLQWILEAKLGHLFSDNPKVVPARKALDKISYGLLPTPKTASKTLLKAFHCAQTEAGLAPASRAKVISARTVTLGDVFLHKEGKFARLIINPACNLVASPFPHRRQPHKDQRVYLLSGSVEPMRAEPVADDLVSSDGFIIEGRPSRVIWNLRSVTSTSYPRLRAALKAANYRFIFRLRPLFALAIQRQFIEFMGRVGLPTTPPYCEPVSVQIAIGGKYSDLKFVGTPIPYAADLVRGKDGLEARLTVDGVSHITDCLKTSLRAIGNRPDADLSDAEKLLKQNKAAIEESLVSSKVWLPFVMEFRKAKVGVLADRVPDFLFGNTKPDSQCKGPFSIVLIRSEDAS